MWFESKVLTFYYSMGLGAHVDEKEQKILKHLKLQRSNIKTVFFHWTHLLVKFKQNLTNDFKEKIDPYTGDGCWRDKTPPFANSG